MKSIILVFSVLSVNLYSQKLEIPNNGQLCLLQHALQSESEVISMYFNNFDSSSKSIDFIFNVNDFFIDYLSIPSDNLTLLEAQFGSTDILVVNDSLRKINQRISSFIETNDYGDKELFNCTKCNYDNCYVLRFSPIVNNLFTVELRAFKGDEWKFKESKKKLNFTFLVDAEGDLIGSIMIKEEIE